MLIGSTEKEHQLKQIVKKPQSLPVLGSGTPEWNVFTAAQLSLARSLTHSLTQCVSAIKKGKIENLRFNKNGCEPEAHHSDFKGFHHLTCSMPFCQIEHYTPFNIIISGTLLYFLHDIFFFLQDKLVFFSANLGPSQDRSFSILKNNFSGDIWYRASLLQWDWFFLNFTLAKEPYRYSSVKCRRINNISIKSQINTKIKNDTSNMESNWKSF